MVIEAFVDGSKRDVRVEGANVNIPAPINREIDLAAIDEYVVCQSCDYACWNAILCDQTNKKDATINHQVLNCKQNVISLVLRFCRCYHISYICC